MKCIQLQNQHCVSVAKESLRRLLHSTCLSLLDNYHATMPAFRGPCFASWNKECTREDHWQHPEGTVTDNLGSTPERSNISLQNCHKRTAEKCNKAIC